MEFFDWISVPQVIVEYLGFSVSSLEELIATQLKIWYICIGVAAGLYAIFLLFGGFGLYTLAKRAGIKHAWVGFLPFGNTYLSGRLAGETNIFGQKMKRIWLYATLAELVFVAINTVILVINVKLCNVAYYSEILNKETNELQGWSFSWEFVPQRIYVLATTMRWIGYATDFVLIFFFCVLYFAFFRKYYARSPFLMTFLCAILPVRGLVLFAVRNNTPVDYNAYMQQRMRAYQTMYGQPPAQGGPSAPSAPAQQPPKEEEPFSDFGEGGQEGNSDPPAPQEPTSGGNDDSPFEDF